MKKALTLFCSIVVLASLGVASVAAYDVNDPLINPCDAYGVSADLCPETTTKVEVQNSVGDIISYAMMAVGALAVIFLIIGGLNYAMSGGDPDKVKKAKSTVLFSLIGLGLAILASVIVSLVTNTSEVFK